MNIVGRVKRSLALVCTFTLVAGCLSACGSADKKASKRVASKEIIESLQPESGGYDPAGATGYDYFTFAQYCLEGLVRYNKDGKTEAAAAEKWESNTKGTEWTFHLRKDGKWSDGSALTSKDFLNTIKRALDPKTDSWYVDGLYIIKGCKAAFEGKGSADEIGVSCPDDYTIKFTLENPCAYFLDYLSLPVYFPSPVKTTSAKNWDKTPSKNLGNGAFHLTEYKAGDFLVYEKNNNYWDKDNIKVSKVTNKIMSDDQALVSAYKTGEIDIASTCPKTVLEQYKDKEDLKQTPSMVTNYILFNINKKPFDDPKVREALSLAVNRKNICSVIGSNNEEATTFIAKNLKSKASDKTWGEEAGEVISEDIAKAKKLLEEAGYPNGKGLPELTYTYPSMGNEAEVAQVLQSSWEKNLGIKVKLNAEEYEVYVADRQAGKLQFCRMQWTGDYNDPATWLNMYTKGSAMNDVKYDNADYNKLVEQSTAEMDATKRNKMMHEAENIIVAEDYVICPLFTTDGLYLINTKLTNLTPAVMGGYKSQYLQVKD
ncbi:oligopeptide ABC transporter, periplasmic oligopeptide-binding protein OppA [Lachnospiraceae bacterium KM106-2]|nr:oligopeptide ABC transporter, periplasmic oligopeptide-binding protein OppA [Lachnospiraceae bacterium KM106-2]